jgi:hypothetical protein
MYYFSAAAPKLWSAPLGGGRCWSPVGRFLYDGYIYFEWHMGARQNVCLLGTLLGWNILLITYFGFKGSVKFMKHFKWGEQAIQFGNLWSSISRNSCYHTVQTVLFSCLPFSLICWSWFIKSRYRKIRLYINEWQGDQQIIKSIPKGSDDGVMHFEESFFRTLSIVQCCFFKTTFPSSGKKGGGGGTYSVGSLRKS